MCRYKVKSAFIVLILGGIVMLAGRAASAQEIDFEKFIRDDPKYALDLYTLGGYDELNFGQVIAGQGQTEIELNSDDIVILAIEGIAYLDVFVTLTPPDHLISTEDPESKMEFTLKAAYANRGEGNTGTAYRQTFSGHHARFPIFRRESGPPGPPPTPPHDGYQPPEETAYLFLYGSIDVISGLQAGEHTGTITVEVAYDL